MFSHGALIYVGDDLLSHTLSRAVQSAQQGLRISVFGMGKDGCFPCGKITGNLSRLAGV